MPRKGENIRRRKDGRWEARYPIYDCVTGKRKVKSVYGKTYSEVKNLRKVIEQNGKLKKEKNVTVVFKQAATEFLLVTQQTKKHSTYIKYKSIYEKYLSSYLDDICLAYITKKLLMQKLDYLYTGQKNISASLLRGIRSLLNMILVFGENHYDVKCDKLSLEISASSKLAIEVFTPIEQSQLLNLLYQEMDTNKLGIIICMSTGLRLGEICALKWSDINFTRGTLKVNRTVQRIAVENQPTKTILLEGEPKSITSKREIPLADDLISLLSLFHTKCEEEYILNGTTPLEPRTYENRFARLLKQAEIEKKNFHILRHTFATNCINSGADVKSLSEILGHSDVKITLNRYVHPALESKRNLVNTLTSIYGQYRGHDTSKSN